MNNDVSKHTLSRSDGETVEYQYKYKECMVPFVNRQHWLYIEGQFVWSHVGARNLNILRDAYTKEGLEIDLMGKKWDKSPLKFSLVFKKGEKGWWCLKK